ncbi:MAG: hypothetical protein K2J13_05145 [Clostridia bacterium]|nr:hypothetical protein [Clostridia bacterium]
MEIFYNESQGQLDFYKRFLPRVNPHLNIDDILSDNNDGVIYGNLLEFKKNARNLNEHLFQCIKYLSARRIKGKPIPSNILIIDLNSATAYAYNSEPYLEYIEQVYPISASKDILGFI